MNKLYFLLLLFFLLVQSGFSQTEKLIIGRVLHENFPVEKVEVATTISKKTTITNAAGEFSIVVKMGDELIFISKNHETKKIVIDQNTIAKNNLIISLTLKPEQLDEVVITKMSSVRLSTDKAYEQGMLDKLTLEKAANTPKILGVYKGTIENPMDFMRIGGMILGLFAKGKEKTEKNIPEIEFTALAKSSYNHQFYIKNLKLTPDEIDLFLQFCGADPKSKTPSQNDSILSIMDFLFAKNIEFKKLKTL
ncbi:hypothetical protein [Flavobacterium sp. ZS1P14]|uniref:hypothetical protein n=1 Tax=Flavobacterium sp. ZS1P14 TaxID=3401729 RepID=UPI003AACB3E6